MDEQHLIPEPEHYALLPEPEIKKAGKKWQWLALSFSVLIVLAIVSYPVFILPPASFPRDTVITIPKGETLSGMADTLSGKQMIRSRSVFKASLVAFGGTRGLQAGDYYFETPQDAITMAFRLSHGLFDLKNIKVTIPEGMNTREIAAIFQKNSKFTHFKAYEFTGLSARYEGYLFPDTYLFLPSISAQDVIDAMLANYKKRIETVALDIKTFGRPIQDVIKMASILEEEGRTADTRETIAGILWKRLDAGMPLQVDSSIVFATGKKTGDDLIPADFKIDSPFNTYVNKGMPPTPISNPGLDTIRAAVHPIMTKYLYYLTDPQGGFHPAVTYAEHLANKEFYLK